MCCFVILLLFNKLSYMRLSSVIPHLCGISWNFAPVLKNICIRLVSWIAPITMIAHFTVCINLLSFCHSFQPSPYLPTKCTESNRYPQVEASRRNCEIRCLKTSRVFPNCRRGDIKCCSFSVHKLSCLYGTR